ncbi:SulP family inorganic anion transporter [Agromyces mediolanus]|uniref:Sodium-independent anion transporter n=1 Tax=Agromyces mediolanus TaxID=41986 RepID=A0A918CJK9_AGRME|nr:SulP family inorganic anion transporter [Agromyces mediolanus]GGR28612.1 sodium-independent anion transporter [Agromyces mediolanus]GLJ72099.1 sodium-independent anion transporter [Agromyces mediolanus]
MARAAVARRGRLLLPTLEGYRPASIPRDLLAGLTAGAVVVPQAMAYATIANLPVQLGLYTCMVPMFVYAMLGGSRAMSVSTTSTIATLTATTLVSAGVAAGSDDPVPDLMALTLLVGVLLLLARLLKAGSAVEYISKATIIGVQVGVGATVAVGQLPKLLGEDAEFSGHGFLRSMVAAVEALPGANLPTVLLSAGSIVVLFLLKRFAKRVPGPLVVVVAGILLVWLAGIDRLGVELIAAVPQGFPPFELPSFAHLGGMLPGALAIAVMAFLESAAVARGIRKPGEPQIDSNRELFATGAANTLGAFFQTLPAAGGFSQSAVNQGAGARSQLASLTTVVLAVLVALFLGPVLSLLPQATLASLVFVAVIGLIEIGAIVELWRTSRNDFWIATLTAVVGLTTGLLYAVLVGLVATFVVILRELSRVRIEAGEPRGGVLPVRLLGGMFTANALAYEQAVLARAGEAVPGEPPIRAVALELTRLETTSITVLDMLADLDRELDGMGVELRLAAVPESGAAMARRGAWFAGMERAGRVYPTLEAATAG